MIANKSRKKMLQPLLKPFIYRSSLSIMAVMVVKNKIEILYFKL